ncbi:NXPE family member 3-like [Pelodytes ibericus]
MSSSYWFTALYVFGHGWQRLTFLLSQLVYRFLRPSRRLPCLPCGHALLRDSDAPLASADQELEDVLTVIDWPEPPAPTDFEFSTSPNITDYQLLPPSSSYHVGDHVRVLITARDHQGRPKTYGGDYFQAKLHSPSLRAGVTGSITDHGDGTYTASFLLLWPGKAEISIILVHSSEAIAILRYKRESRPDKNYFQGLFEQNGSSEVMECNINPPSVNVCTYNDPGTRETWYCVRPPRLPCDSYSQHRPGGTRSILSPAEAKLLSRSIREKRILSKVEPITVLLEQISQDDRGVCSPGLPIPDPSGYYYGDFWHSRVCRNRKFSHPDNVTACLKGHIIYMFGDPTLRQWWQYLVDFIPSLQQLDLHFNHGAGPLLATDTEHGILVHWRSHQRPLSMTCPHLQELHYIANELDGIGGRRENLVIVINCMAHFVPFPVSVYVRRMQGIRNAVVRLLNRSPQTKVFIKSGNTGHLYIHGSDWLSLQLDTVMRIMFSGVPVTLLDAWQMTSCHHSPRNIHPGKVIVKNEVDLMLSFICPQ